MAQPAQVDPNIQAILGQHQQQLQIIQNQQQQDAQRAAQQADERRFCRWLVDQEKKVDVCDGKSLKDVRIWLRQINCAVDRIPGGANADEYLFKLMCATSTDDLLEEIEGHVRANAPNQVAHGQIRAHVNLAFLGPDEANLLKEVVENLKQGHREDIASYNRRFSKAADYAYPQPRNPQTDEELTDVYMSSLKDGKVKDSVFEHDPALVTLQGAMQVALGEFARQSRRKRVQRKHTTHEPMEVDEIASSATSTPTVRDTLAAMASSLRTLQKEVRTMKEGKPSPIPSYQNRQNHGKTNGNQRKPNGHRRAFEGRCWYCHQAGHPQAVCFQRQRDGAPMKAPPQSTQSPN
ncbi:MAG: hypothetical protein GY702_02175 [Desulfobulbaceae bacterium]|nr:hypothetical protein [Desulfobulbaceae bacterium]